MACEPGLRRVRVTGALVDVSIYSAVGGIFWCARPDPEFGWYRVKVARLLVEVGRRSIVPVNAYRRRRD